MDKKRKLISIMIGFSVVCLLFAAGGYYKTWKEGQEADQRAKRLLAYYLELQDSIVNQAELPVPNNVVKEEIQEESQEESQEEIPSYDVSLLDKYPMMAILSMDTIGTVLPVIDRFTDELLTVSACRYEGPTNPAEDGNIVISGHNYRNGAHFGKLKQIQIGDVVKLTDANQLEYSYEVLEIETVVETDIAAIENTLSARALTLFSCNEKGDKRLIVRCKAI